MRKRTVFISFFTSCTQPCPSEMSAHTHPVCDVCVCARSGSCLTEGVSEAWCWGNCHRSCRFWTVYSRIMMTYKQTRLLSSLYLYTSAPWIRFIHLDPGTVYWDMTPPRTKKGILLWRSAPCIRFIHLYLGVNAWRRACLKRGALKKYLNCLTVLLYTVMYIPFGTKWWLFNFGMAQILFMD